MTVLAVEPRPVELAERVEVDLPLGASVVVCSDLHLGPSRTAASAAVAADLADRIEALTGPGAVVLAGDCFELLGVADPSVAASLDAHPDLERAVARFGQAGSDRHVVVLAGDHDGRLAWDPESRSVLERRLGASVALVADLVLATGRGRRVVRVEHGHRMDPANAFRDPTDPNDTPLGYHVVQEVLPELSRRRSLDDAAALVDRDQLGQFVASRLVYRELARRAWILLVPIVVALLIRTPLLVRGLSDRHGVQVAGRWLLVGGVGLVIDAVVFGAVALLMARRVFHSLAPPSLRPPGGARNEAPRAAAEALCGEGFAGFVTGHTHRPELTAVPGGFYANAGCGTPLVVSTPARMGLPPVFSGVDRRSWLELDGGRDLEVRLVAAEAPGSGVPRLERLVATRREVLGPEPVVVASLPGGPTWPVLHPALRSVAQRRRSRRTAALLVVATAVVSIVSAVTPPDRPRLRAILRLMPVELPQAMSAAVVFGSVGLLLLARGLRRGQRLAWSLTEIVLVATALLHLGKGIDVEEAVVALVVAAWLWVERRDFDVRPDRRTLRRGAVFAIAGPVLAVGLSLALVTIVGAHRRRDVDESIPALAERLAGHSSTPLSTTTPFVTPALVAVGLGLLVGVGWTASSPARPGRRDAADHLADRERARAIVERWGGDTLAYFALRDDKSWFFTGSCVVAYAVRNGVCLVAPDPIGPPHEWADAWSELRLFAERNGWSVAVVGAQPGWLPLYEASGMRAIYMGDEAIVDCLAFSLEGGRMKGLRQACNRVKRAGYTVRFFDPATVEPALRAELSDLMTETRQGEAERGFSMTLSRIFDPHDTGLLLAVAFDVAGRAVAFCQYAPAADIDGWSLDLMRRRADPDLPNGVTDFVVTETIEHLRASKQWGLALNFAVMREIVAGERSGGWWELERRVLHKFSESMQIESLWRYNQKFQPYWRPRYVVVDSLDYVASHGLAIADAEALADLPLLGRLVGSR